MIGRLSGLLAEKSPPMVLLDVHGVGYEVDVPMSTFYNLPALGEPVTLLTHFVVREDAQVLFGFLTAPERATFRLLVKISGVGPRTALSILSGLSVGELAQAVTRQDGARLVKVPGIGKKTAERLLLELKGKLGPDLALPNAVAERRPGRHRAGAAGAGLQRPRSAGGTEGAARGCRRQRRHQAGAEGAEPLNATRRAAATRFNACDRPSAWPACRPASSPSSRPSAHRPSRSAA
jgi:holliday junction DNA helicase RuvA